MLQLCEVTFSIKDESGPVRWATVKAEVDIQNSTVEGSLITLKPIIGVTDANGICVLNLIRRDSFKTGGIYHVTAVAPSNERLLYDRRVYVMNASSGTADNLIPA